MTPYKTCKYGAILPRQDLLHSLQRTRASRDPRKRRLLGPQKNAGFSGFSGPRKRGLLGPPKTRASRALIARKASLGPKKRGLLVPMRRHVVNKTRALASMPNTRKLLAHNTSGLPCLTHASFSRITQAGIPLPNTMWTLLSPPSPAPPSPAWAIAGNAALLQARCPRCRAYATDCPASLDDAGRTATIKIAARRT